MTGRAALTWLAWLLAGSPALAQAPRESLRLSGLAPGGAGLAATSSWQSFDVNITNFTDMDRQARVFLFFEDDPGAHYGRDFWMPAATTLSSWMLVGPAPVPQKGKISDVQFLLYDRTAGIDQLLLPPTEERIRARGVLYRKREPTSVLLLDEEDSEPDGLGKLPRPESAAEEALHLVRSVRQACGLSELVPVLRPGPLPPVPEALEGVDHFVIASNRLRDDPLGAKALRQWLLRGGAVWIMLDLVDPESVAPLLEDSAGCAVVDRVSLTDFQLDTRGAGGRKQPGIVEQHERAVTLARVVLPAGEEAEHTVNGWPAWFSRNVGRGRVVFTTLGARGWYRPRRSNDPASPFANFPKLPIALPPLEIVAEAVQPPRDEHPFRTESLQPMLAEEIGYAVVSRWTVVAILLGFLAAALGVGLLIKKWSRPELQGWLGPAAAVGATVVLLAQGYAARQSAAPSLAIAQIVHAAPDRDEANVHGLLALYRPESGLVSLGAERGGMFELDMAGIDQTRRFLQTDLDAWKWENLALPAGVRLAPFRAALALSKPIQAKLTFGPNGIEGKLSAEAWNGLSDAILTTSSRRTLAVRLEKEGSLHAGSREILPEGQFISGAVLSDEQQRRQDIYGEFVKKKRFPRGGDEEHQLLAWAEPADLGFTFGSDVRRRGSMLLVVPVRFERAPAGQQLTIPGPLVSVRRIFDDLSTQPTWEADIAADMHLRFQLPRAALPMKVEKARLSAKIDAPARRVVISGRVDRKQVELFRTESPLETIRLEIDDASLLRLDAEGGLHLNLSISEEFAAPKVQARGGTHEKWVMRHLELEVAGRAE